MSFQRPLELFGFPTHDACPTGEPWDRLRTELANAPVRDAKCPFCEENCNKIRKAKPNPLIGNCTAGLIRKGEHAAWIVCPKRFEQDDIIFKDAAAAFGLTGTTVYLAKELKLGGAGNLDFALVTLKDDKVDDFIGIEVQSMGTSGSGSIWTARNDYLAGALKEQYSYGMNTKDASKKILVQMLHKGRQLSRLKKKYLLVIQDHLLGQLRSQFDLSHFRPADAGDFVYIHSYKLECVNGKYLLKLQEKISIDSMTLPSILAPNPDRDKLVTEKSLQKTVSDKRKRGKVRELPATI